VLGATDGGGPSREPRKKRKKSTIKTTSIDKGKQPEKKPFPQNPKKKENPLQEESPSPPHIKRKVT